MVENEIRPDQSPLPESNDFAEPLTPEEEAAALERYLESLGPDESEGDEDGEGDTDIVFDFDMDTPSGYNPDGTPYYIYPGRLTSPSLPGE